MTNTLEQRAEFVATLQEMLDQDYPAAGHDCLPQFSVERAALTAAIAALRLSAGADWVLVPREPTGDMLDAMIAPWMRSAGSERECLTAGWTGALAAAPRHEPGEFRPCRCHTQRDKELCLHKRECSVVTAQQEKSP